jgi:hypothetical protein
LIRVFISVIRGRDFDQREPDRVELGVAPE